MKMEHRNDKNEGGKEEGRKWGIKENHTKIDFINPGF